MQEKFKEKKLSLNHEKKPIIDIVEKIAADLNLDYDVIFGIVLVSTPERLWPGLSSYSLTLEKQSSVPKGINDKLAKDASYDFWQMTPKEILAQIASKQEIHLDVSDSTALAKGKEIQMRFDNVKLIDILKMICAAYGDDIKIDKEKLEFVPVGKK